MTCIPQKINERCIEKLHNVSYLSSCSPSFLHQGKNPGF
jgi:hypothetical protein